MKTRYKIIIVIAATAVFYIGLPSLLTTCMSFTDDCFVFQQMMYHTRLTVPDSIFCPDCITWAGTVEEIEEPRLDFLLQENIDFIFFVLVVPFLAIVGLIIKDKKK
jgi:hypothetical protein